MRENQQHIQFVRMTRSQDTLPDAFRTHLSAEDIRQNSTLQSFEQIRGQLRVLERERRTIDTILDVGCNRGGFVTALAAHLGAERVYGIETDSEMREHADSRGVETFAVDAESEAFPIATDSVDLVLSFGLLEHLRYYDSLFSETNRVLDDGWFWVTSPNLASWLNRIALLFGYQPRNVELSRERAVGALPVYDRDEFLNHVHAPTYRALIELLEQYGFEPITSAPLMPYQRGRVDALFDSLFSVRVGLSRRVSVLSKQSY